MALSLYDVTVVSFQQTLGAVAGFLDRGLAHCGDNDIDPAVIDETRLHPDMFPFRFQVVSVAHHTLGALKGAQAGQFAPPSDPGPLDYAGLQALVAQAREGLAALTPEAVNALEGRDVVFEARGFKLPCTCR